MIHYFEGSNNIGVHADNFFKKYITAMIKYLST